tara:strand:+ start:2278 stop:2901 length:624 start_codon:yes stop_codon:yes gene_type:complete
MNKNRLITFGCSLTYGSALENPNDAWPNQLATKWNLDLVNMGISGSSTKRIWWEIMNFDFKKTDTVVVLWTHMDRWCILKKDNNHLEWDIPGKIVLYEKRKPESTLQVKVSEAYYKYLHDDFDMLTQYLCYTNHAANYLDELVGVHYHLRASEIDKNLPFNSVDFLPVDLDLIQQDHPKATDGIHPGKEAYTEFVNQINNQIYKETL